MSGVLRLTLVSHAMTDAMAAGRFPADEPLNTIGVNDIGRQAETVGRLDRGGRCLCGPERRARQTAKLLGLQAATEPRLADLDCGRWRGGALDAVPSGDLQVWLSDPGEAPHGGESIVDLVDRVAGWLASLTESTVAVTHPAVIRAAILVALDSPPKSFWRVDIAPLSRTVLHRRAESWTLRVGR